MRPMLFRCAVLCTLALVVAPDVLPLFEAETASAAPARRRGRRVSRYQQNRAQSARLRQQQRVRAQQLARFNQAQMAALARLRMNNANLATANRLQGGAPGLGNGPMLVNKDYQLQIADPVKVSSLVPLGKQATFEDVAVGNTVTVTIVQEKDEAGKTRAANGELTGRVVKVESNSVKELTLRVSSYQNGAKNGEATVVPPVAGQSVTALLIRTRAQGAAGLFKQ